jgi:GNAT superfamily N-acetyltransferase
MYGLPGWHFYIAFVEEVPAAIALLHIQGKTASLAAGATMPQFRGKGCQMALIQQRITDAAEAECTLVVTQERAGTASQRNMERVGLRVAYTKALWTALES